MKTIISYNINGIRAAFKKGLAEWISDLGPDIVCLQEIKANPDQFNQQAFNEIGYECYINSAERPGYSGVAILSRHKPNTVHYGCGIKEIDFEGRILRLDFDNFSVMSVYFPSGSSGEIRQDFKLKFLTKFKLYIEKLKKDFPNLIISGDFNICHTELDIHNPIRNKNTSGFLPEERTWLTEFLALGFIDSFRYLNSKPNNYTWWSYRANARDKNLGWRIDYNMVSSSLLPRIRRALILSEVKHSDHCPVLVQIES